MFDDPAIFLDEGKARDWLEALLWPAGPVCPHCGCVDNATKLQGRTHRAGVLKCKPCGKQFTVTVGTLFERSHVPLNRWLFVAFEMCASKKGISAHQVMRMIGVTYRTAWFMCHRIREAMRDGTFPGPLGGQNKVVEIDETYVGGKARNQKNRIPPKEPVVALVEREGKVRSSHVANVDGENLRPILREQIDRSTYVMTDESPIYPGIASSFSGHGTVNHSIEEYVRGIFWHTNTVESYFAVLKRGIIGTYHAVSAHHLKRYLGEFDFRYNERVALGVDDAERTKRALKGIVGKRLTYRRISGGTEAQEASQT